MKRFLMLFLCFPHLSSSAVCRGPTKILVEQGRRTLFVEYWESATVYRAQVAEMQGPVLKIHSVESKQGWVWAPLSPDLGPRDYFFIKRGQIRGLFDAHRVSRPLNLGEVQHPGKKEFRKKYNEKHYKHDDLLTKLGEKDRHIYLEYEGKERAALVGKSDPGGDGLSMRVLLDGRWISTELGPEDLGSAQIDERAFWHIRNARYQQDPTGKGELPMTGIIEVDLFRHAFNVGYLSDTTHFVRINRFGKFYLAKVLSFGSHGRVEVVPVNEVRKPVGPTVYLDETDIPFVEIETGPPLSEEPTFGY